MLLLLLISTQLIHAQAKVQVAILLDTSNSMDGLIEQAKSQLWKIVNELSTARYEGKEPKLEIALYEYGSDNLSVRTGYIRKLSDLATDLDKISKSLFELKTNGGSEYCGNVIDTAVKSLEWSKADNDLHMIFIAGNETFEQGPINYREAIAYAKGKGIVVNTIYCGNWDQGVSEKWKDAALAGQGEYLNIDQDKKTVYIATPFDKKILDLNQRLNQTYYGYGSKGQERKIMQTAQDNNAVQYSQENMVSRAISKSKKAYNNATWDLVDAYTDDKKFVDNVKQADLPQEFQGKTKAQLTTELDKLVKERAQILAEIAALEKSREKFQQEEMAKQGIDADKTLDQAVMKSVKKQAIAKKYTF
ncbi:MAG: hypothetical protein RIS47_909 [Bacteroidota bacterium]